MGKLSGVNANLITKVSGVPVANISKVGPVLASSIGLGGGGGGGKLYTTISFNPPRAACVVGPSTENTQTLYYNSGDNIFYLDAGFITPFLGDDFFYYNATDNEWTQIGIDGGLKSSASC